MSDQHSRSACGQARHGSVTDATTRRKQPHVALVAFAQHVVEPNPFTAEDRTAHMRPATIAARDEQRVRRAITAVGQTPHQAYGGK